MNNQLKAWYSAHMCIYQYANFLCHSLSSPQRQTFSEILYLQFNWFLIKYLFYKYICMHIYTHMCTYLYHMHACIYVYAKITNLFALLVLKHCNIILNIWSFIGPFSCSIILICFSSMYIYHEVDIPQSVYPHFCQWAFEFYCFQYKCYKNVFIAFLQIICYSHCLWKMTKVSRLWISFFPGIDTDSVSELVLGFDLLFSSLEIYLLSAHFLASHLFPWLHGKERAGAVHPWWYIEQPF